MSTADVVIASIVFGPSAVLGTAFGVGVLVGLPRRRYLRGLLNECRALNADEYGGPTGGPGQPNTVTDVHVQGNGAGEQLAEVIPFPDRRAA